jgi:transcriptional regulator with XRE-family HTH domain
VNVPFDMLLRGLRAARDLTQSELAQHAGITQSTLSHLERGDALPQRRTARKLAAALDVPADTFDAYVRLTGNVFKKKAA